MNEVSFCYDFSETINPSINRISTKFNLLGLRAKHIPCCINESQLKISISIFTAIFYALGKINVISSAIPLFVEVNNLSLNICNLRLNGPRQKHHVVSYSIFSKLSCNFIYAFILVLTSLHVINRIANITTPHHPNNSFLYYAYPRVKHRSAWRMGSYFHFGSY